VAYDHSFDVEKIPDAEVSGLRVRTTPISDRLDFPDGLTSIGYELYCIRVVVDIVHPDRSDLRVELRLPDAVGWRVVYENGKPGPDLHLSIDRAWSRPDWAKLRITDVDPVDEGALVYWRVEGHYRSGSFPPLPPVLA
jgi:subtilisin-like proprotein convertase family protein